MNYEIDPDMSALLAAIFAGLGGLATVACVYSEPTIIKLAEAFLAGASFAMSAAFIRFGVKRD